ncbi:caspase domain-containing protein [Kitasatospora sp. NPDC059646]|uniref:caspase family protein n=1 Tax=Kitasatospora sp. NPDC059646 TaxID=3346893 RepID=UPI0036A95997
MADAAPPAGSHAVLIGVPEYDHPDFPPVPAARNSVRAMSALLRDPQVCGWQEQQITVIDDVSSGPELAGRVADVAEKATGTLLLYYSGHGMLSPAGDLCLVMPGTRPDRPTITGLPWGNLAEAMRLSPARSRITVLDSCFAGRAIEVLTPEAQALADLAEVEGVYTLTATTRNRTAHVPPLAEQRDRPTTFTGQLCDLLRAGIPGKPEYLTLNDIYPALRARLRAAGLPVPHQCGTGGVGQVVFARNAARPAFVEPVISGNPVVLEPGTPFGSRLAEVAAAWAGRGRSKDWLVSGKAFFAVYLWSLAEKKLGHPVDPLTGAYIDACYRAVGGSRGWSDLLWQRERCACHGERWKTENLNICLDCLRYQCMYVDRTCGACGGRVVG